MNAILGIRKEGLNSPNSLRQFRPRSAKTPRAKAIARAAAADETVKRE
jgi:hypothetical protein